MEGPPRLRDHRWLAVFRRPWLACPLEAPALLAFRTSVGVGNPVWREPSSGSHCERTMAVARRWSG